MPNLRTHCAISRKRTGRDFEDLHKWIDSPSKELGMDHRVVRHAYNRQDEDTIRSFWEDKERGLGEKAVVEWLFHIAIDNLDTAFKKSWRAYKNNRYNFLQFGLTNSGYIHIEPESLNQNELERKFKDAVVDDGSDDPSFMHFLKEFDKEFSSQLEKAGKHVEDLSKKADDDTAKIIDLMNGEPNKKKKKQEDFFNSRF